MVFVKRVLVCIVVTLAMAACGGGESPSGSGVDQSGGGSPPAGSVGSGGSAGSGNLISPVPDGRRWTQAWAVEKTSGELLDFLDRPGMSIGLADDGTSTVAFAQKNAQGVLQVLVARGNAGRGDQPAMWDEPIVLDGLYPIANAVGRPRVAVSPVGNAIVVWPTKRVCNPDGFFPTSPSCVVLVASRLMVGASRWEDPVLVSEAADDHGEPLVFINDQGDTAIVFAGPKTPSDQRRSFSAYNIAAAFRSAGDVGWRVQHTPEIQLHSGLIYFGGEVFAGLDAAGNLTIVGERYNELNTRDLVALRGTVLGGLGVSPKAVELEALSGLVDVFGVSVGLDGTVAVAYRQDTPARKAATLLAVLLPNRVVWESEDITLLVGKLSTPDVLDFLETPVAWAMRVPDQAQGNVVFFRECTVVRRVAGTWQPSTQLPGKCYWGQTDRRGSFAMDRNGSFVFLDPAGRWSAYDITRNGYTKRLTDQLADATVDDYVLGVKADPRMQNDLNQLLMTDTVTVSMLVPSGTALFVVRSPYALMPSAAAPFGDAGKLHNLWAMYYRH